MRLKDIATALKAQGDFLIKTVQSVEPDVKVCSENSNHTIAIKTLLDEKKSFRLGVRAAKPTFLYSDGSFFNSGSSRRKSLKVPKYYMGIMYANSSVNFILNTMCEILVNRNRYKYAYDNLLAIIRSNSARLDSDVFTNFFGDDTSYVGLAQLWRHSYIYDSYDTNADAEWTLKMLSKFMSDYKLETLMPVLNKQLLLSKLLPK